MSDTPILDALIRLQDSRKETWHVPPEYIDDLARECAALRAERDGLQIARDAANSLARQYMNQVGNLTAEVERKQVALERLIDYFHLYSTRNEMWQDEHAFELSDELNAARRAALSIGENNVKS